MFREGPCLRWGQVSAHRPLLGDVAQAKAPKLGPAPQYFYRFKVGDAEVTVVSDGALDLGDPKGTFTGVSDDEMRKMLTDNFLPPANIVLEQNSPIVNIGDKLVLFDTGMGTSKMFGTTTGRQQKSMKEAGIKPEDIDAVVFSHGHIDHIGGVVGEDGKNAVPERAILHRRERLQLLDRLRQGRPEDEGLRGPRQEEPDAGARPPRVLQGRAGIPARSDRAGGAGPHRRPHHLRDLVGRQIVLPTPPTSPTIRSC